MTGITLEGPIYREPSAPARFFIYAFALATPLLTLVVLVLPAALVANYGSSTGGVVIASTVTLGYIVCLAAAVRRVRRLAVRFTPPLALPGDIWNIGVAQPPRRSKNWPLRLVWRRPPDDGKTRVAA